MTQRDTAPGRRGVGAVTAEPGVLSALRRCVAQWQGAASLFDEVTEPALVDYAIYAMSAAESMYRHIAAQAVREGVAVEDWGSMGPGIPS